MLLCYEGFDHETNSADLYAGILTTLIVTGASQTAALTLSGSTQYATGQCLAVTATSSTNTAANAFAIMSITPAANTVIIGAAISLTSSPTNGAVFGVSNANAGQVYCFIGAGGLKIFRGDPTGVSVQLGSAIQNVVASVGWAYIELKIVVATGSSGSVQVQVNGTTVALLSGLNTSADGTTVINGVMLGTANTAVTASFTSYFDDVYVCDTIGSTPYNAFLAPVRVVTQFPVGNGSVTNFTGLALHPNWQNVNQVTDFDATYNYSNTIGSIDSFIAAVLPASASGIFAVKITGAGRVDDAGLRTVQTYLKSGLTSAAGTNVNLAGSYQYFSDIYTVDPNISANWTPSSVNLLQFGYKIVPSPGVPMALGVVVIVPSIVGNLLQINSMSGVSKIPVKVLSLIVAVVTATASIGTIVTRATMQVVVSASATVQLAIALKSTTTLIPGLFLTITQAIGFKLSSTLTLATSVSAAIPVLRPAASGQIVPGISASGRGAILPSVSSSVSLAMSANAVTPIKISFAVSMFVAYPATARGQIGAIAVSSTVLAPLASNIHIGLAAWIPSHNYTTGARVASTVAGVTNAYQAIATGLSGTTAPNGTGSNFIDGALSWKYLSHIDYADLASWEASIPATLTQSVVGLIWNNGTITTTAGTPFLTLGKAIAPRVTGSNTITLRAALGEGIRDALALGTVPLTFDATKGVSFTLPSGTGGINYFDIYDSNVFIDGLQFRDPNPTSGSSIIHQENTSNNLTVSDCIIDGYAQPGGATMVQGGTKTFTLFNCLIIDRQTALGIATTAINLQSPTNHVVNCTLIGGKQVGTPTPLTTFPGAFQFISLEAAHTATQIWVATNYGASPSSVLPVSYLCSMDRLLSPSGVQFIGSGTNPAADTVTFTNLAAGAIYRVQVWPNNATGNGPPQNLTIVTPLIISATNILVYGPVSAAIVANSTASVVKNNIIIGYATPVGNPGGKIAPVDHCLFDTSSIGPGGLDSGGNLFLKTAGNQFISATNDFRLKAGADALNVGTTAITDIPLSTDIAGTHRPSGVAWDIGCSER